MISFPIRIKFLAIVNILSWPTRISVPFLLFQSLQKLLGPSSHGPFLSGNAFPFSFRTLFPISFRKYSHVPNRKWISFSYQEITSISHFFQEMYSCSQLEGISFSYQETTSINFSSSCLPKFSFSDYGMLQISQQCTSRINTIWKPFHLMDVEEPLTLGIAKQALNILQDVTYTSFKTERKP